MKKLTGVGDIQRNKMTRRLLGVFEDIWGVTFPLWKQKAILQSDALQRSSLSVFGELEPPATLGEGKKLTRRGTEAHHTDLCLYADIRDLDFLV